MSAVRGISQSRQRRRILGEPNGYANIHRLPWPSEAELLKLLSSQPDKQAVGLLVNWCRQLAKTGRIDPKDYHLFERVYRSAEEAKMSFLEQIQEERRKFFQKRCA